MRKPSALFARNSRPQSQFSIRELLLWMVILSLLFAGCSSSWKPSDWERALWVFSPAIKLSAAAGVTLLLEVIAAGLAARVPQRAARRDRPVIRRYWYRSNRRDFGELTGGPCLPIIVYLNIFLAYRIFIMMSVMWPAIPSFFLTPNDVGVSYWLMCRLVIVAFVGYLIAHLIYGLLPMTPSSRRERFQLVLAVILISTTYYAPP